MTRAGPAGGAAAVALALVEDFDWRAFGFASSPGVPRPDDLRFLLAAGLRLGAPHAARAALVGLDALVKGDGYDSLEGGLFDSCAAAGWRDPSTGKSLELNAQFLRALAAAVAASTFSSTSSSISSSSSSFSSSSSSSSTSSSISSSTSSSSSSASAQREAFARAAYDTARWADRSLSRTQDDLWASSLPEDADYYGRMAHGRSRRGPPAPIDEVDVAACALACSAFAEVGAALQDRALAARGRLCLQALLDGAVDEHGHVRARLSGGHWSKARSPVARVRLAAAVLDVWSVTGDPSLPGVLHGLTADFADPGFDAAPEAVGLLLLRIGAAFSRGERMSTGRPRLAGGGAPVVSGRWAARGEYMLAREAGVTAVVSALGNSLAIETLALVLPFGPAAVRYPTEAGDSSLKVVLEVDGNVRGVAERRSQLRALAAALQAPAAVKEASG